MCKCHPILVYLQGLSVGTNVHYRNLGNNSLSGSFPSHLLACSNSTLQEMWVHIKIHFLKFCKENLKWEDPYHLFVKFHYVLISFVNLCTI